MAIYVICNYRYNQRSYITVKLWSLGWAGLGTINQLRGKGKERLVRLCNRRWLVVFSQKYLQHGLITPSNPYFMQQLLVVNNLLFSYNNSMPLQRLSTPLCHCRDLLRRRNGIFLITPKDDRESSMNYYQQIIENVFRGQWHCPLCFLIFENLATLFEGGKRVLFHKSNNGIYNNNVGLLIICN